MTQKRLNHAHILNRLVTDSNFTNKQAAEAASLSERQIIRLKGEYKKQGIDALVHKNIGKPPAHAFSEELRNTIIDLKTSKPFEKANFKHFQEILARDEYGINISYSSLHSLLTSAGIKSPMTRRSSNKHRRRKRKAYEGLLLQIDASPFDWLGIGQDYSLHGAIDDATGKITALYLCKNECLQGYFEIMRSTINNNGIPVSLYADMHSIFCSPKSGKLSIEEQLQGYRVNDTQFGRAVKQLGINLIKARSPQAKGRIERLWGTLQNRLPIEFALNNISSVDDANFFLKSYINNFNAKFAVEPESNEPSYRDVSPALNIDNILCIIEKRSFDNGGVFSFYNRSFKLLPYKTDSVLPHRGKLDVLISPVFGVRAAFAGIVYEVMPFIKPEKVNKTSIVKSGKQKFIPDDSHYYKYGHQLIKKVTFEDNDIAILKMLEKIFLWRLPPAS
jgi:transposase